jgi:hypothetical protein
MLRFALVLLLQVAAVGQGQKLLLYFQQVPVGEEVYTLTPGELRARFQYTERGTTIVRRGGHCGSPPT